MMNVEALALAAGDEHEFLAGRKRVEQAPRALEREMTRGMQSEIRLVGETELASKRERGARQRVLDAPVLGDADDIEQGEEDGQRSGFGLMHRVLDENARTRR